MNYKFYLDGNQVTEPAGATEIITSILKDTENNALLATTDNNFKFIKDGYDYLFNALNTQGFCQNVDVKVLISENGYDFKELVTGLIKVSQVEFSEWDMVATTRIEDASYDSKINNNKSIEVVLQGQRSKNNLPLTSPTPVIIELFDVITATHIPVTAGAGNEAQGYGYRVFDVLKYIVQFMTDGELLFKSSIFDVGGIYENVFITSGYMIKGYDGGTTTVENFNLYWPKLTWENAYKEIKNKYNTSFLIEDNGGQLTFRLEGANYLSDNTLSMLTVNNLYSLKTRTDISRIFSAIKFDSGLLEFGSAYSFPEDINFVGFKNESYHTVGSCNIDHVLDLSGTWVTSSNAIQEALDRANLSSMDDTAIVLIDCNAYDSGVYPAKMSNWLTTASTPKFYNEVFNNSNISIRFLGGVPNAIAQFLAGQDGTFTAFSENQDPTLPFLYYDNGNDPERKIMANQESSDPGNNYDPSNYYYSAAFASVFTFYGFSRYALFNNSGIALNNNVTLVLRRTDVSGGFISDTIIASESSTLNAGNRQIYEIFGSNSIVLNSTDRAYLYFAVGGDLINYTIYPQAEFSCTAIAGGGIVQTYEASDYSILRHEFTYKASLDEHFKILSDPRGYIEFSLHNDNPRKGFIESYKRNNQTGETTFILNSSRNLNK